MSLLLFVLFIAKNTSTAGDLEGKMLTVSWELMARASSWHAQQWQTLLLAVTTCDLEANTAELQEGFPEHVDTRRLEEMSSQIHNFTKTNARKTIYSSPASTSCSTL